MDHNKLIFTINILLMVSLLYQNTVLSIPIKNLSLQLISQNGLFSS